MDTSLSDNDRSNELDQSSDQADNNEEIPTIIVDPVDDGREVSQDTNILFMSQQLEFQTCV